MEQPRQVFLSSFFQSRLTEAALLRRHLQVLDKLRVSLDSHNFYEAQQMLKTVYHRYRARKQHVEAYQLLEVRPGVAANTLPFLVLLL